MADDDTPVQDWTAMRRADFDTRAELALADADTVVRPVLAVPDECGTEALFGEAPPSGRRRASRSRPAGSPNVTADTLF
ncbi:hypothetical protein ACIQU7_23970 [Streptomyces albidoflavus]